VPPGARGRDCLGALTPAAGPPRLLAGNASPGAGAQPVPRPVPMAPVCPLDRFPLPPALDGRAGSNRRPPGDATPVFANDRDAIEAWLGVSAAAGSDGPAPRAAHTRRAYHREAERFLLWCVIERGKALSSIDAADCLAYRAFLADPQPRARWCVRPSPGRQSTLWRPFAGPLGAAGQRQAVAALSSLFGFLVERGYLWVNPWRAGGSAMAIAGAGAAPAAASAASGAAAPASAQVNGSVFASRAAFALRPPQLRAPEPPLSSQTAQTAQTVPLAQAAQTPPVVQTAQTPPIAQTALTPLAAQTAQASQTAQTAQAEQTEQTEQTERGPHPAAAPRPTAARFGSPPALQAVEHSARRPSPRPLDPSRSLSPALWATVLARADALPAVGRHHRLRFALRWLYATGLRLSEAVHARLGDLVQVPPDDGEARGGWWLRVRAGGGGRERELPLPDMLITALSDYLCARGLDPDPSAATQRDAFVLGQCVDRGERASRLPLPGPIDARRGVRASTLARQLKQHFGACATACAEAGDTEAARHLAAASAHWLRHTHARHLLANGLPLELAQRHLGHATRSTTAAYLVADRQPGRADWLAAWDATIAALHGSAPAGDAAAASLPLEASSEEPAS